MVTIPIERCFRFRPTVFLHLTTPLESSLDCLSRLCLFVSASPTAQRPCPSVFQVQKTARERRFDTRTCPCKMSSVCLCVCVWIQLCWIEFVQLLLGYNFTYGLLITVSATQVKLRLPRKLRINFRDMINWFAKTWSQANIPTSNDADPLGTAGSCLRERDWGGLFQKMAPYPRNQAKTNHEVVVCLMPRTFNLLSNPSLDDDCDGGDRVPMIFTTIALWRTQHMRLAGCMMPHVFPQGSSHEAREMFNDAVHQKS